MWWPIRAGRGRRVLTSRSRARFLPSIADDRRDAVVQAASGEISLTVTSPPEFAGTYVTDTALLASGPVNLVPPVVWVTPSRARC
jgi:hypothetical protein